MADRQRKARPDKARERPAVDAAQGPAVDAAQGPAVDAAQGPAARPPPPGGRPAEPAHPRKAAGAVRG
ncbi:hypothetical protein [Sphaerisporangium dianthi]|uniref:Uncharacterized protein n=1 Tax=Sphaerisporangium dianthi TaxID=1436120 RepID=A0ABV9CU92_9ACTN